MGVLVGDALGVVVGAVRQHQRSFLVLNKRGVLSLDSLEDLVRCGLGGPYMWGGGRGARSGPVWVS